MNNLLLFIFGNLQLRVVEAIAVGLTGLSLMGIVLLIHTRHRLIKTVTTRIDAEGNSIVSVAHIQDTSNLDKRHKIILIFTTCLLVLAMACICTYSYYNSLALRYGAYGNGQKIQTINEIFDYTYARGFVDQSNELPEDLKGTLIIYFKYGCPDCRAIHDDIIQCLNDNNVTNVYFVSSRSEKGSELLKTYPVNEVPAGVYVRIQPSTVSDRFTEVLYGHTYDEENNEIVLFEADKMLSLIKHQQNGD